MNNSIEVERLGLSCLLSPNTPEVFTFKEHDALLRKLSGKRICVDFQEDIDGPQTAVRLIKETLRGFGVIFRDLKNVVDAYVWIQQGSQEMRFVFVVANPFNKKQYLCYECGPRELTASIMMAIYNFFYGAIRSDATPPATDKIEMMIASIDTAEPEAIQQIEDEIVQRGKQCVGALITSAKSCNRKITVATMAEDLGAIKESIQVLERRIRILGRIGDPKAISTILNALADSSVCVDMFTEAMSLCKTASEALVSIGKPAIPYLKNNANDRQPSVRKAVRSVLSRLEPKKKWWQF